MLRRLEGNVSSTLKGQQGKNRLQSSMRNSTMATRMNHDPGAYEKKRIIGFGLNTLGARWRCRRGTQIIAIHAAIFAAVLMARLAGGIIISTQAAEPQNSVTGGTSVRKLSFPPPAEMVRADLYTWCAVKQPLAVLVLCPGFNGNGEWLLRRPEWQEFSRANQLALCAISFASPEKEVRALHGYFHASRGSGKLLLSGIRLSFGRDLPILIHGFSGGARFAISFVGGNPERVLSWCAYSACWWEDPQAPSTACPPGIVACGEEDSSNYGTSTTYFAKGRAAGLPWTWVSIGQTGHAWSEPLDCFVRVYFKVFLDHLHGSDNIHQAIGSTNTWYDVDTKEEISAATASAQPVLASWLPDKSLSSLWSSLHCP
jgi:hypothetical protein